MRVLLLLLWVVLMGVPVAAPAPQLPGIRTEWQGDTLRVEWSQAGCLSIADRQAGEYHLTCEGGVLDLRSAGVDQFYRAAPGRLLRLRELGTGVLLAEVPIPARPLVPRLVLPLVAR